MFDPDHGVDFAYTTGLAALAGAELHMWCQPSEGPDPGDGFRLSLQDMGHALNAFAARFAEGSLAIGDTIDQPLDGGLTQATFTFNGPVDAETTGARASKRSRPVTGTPTSSSAPAASGPRSGSRG